MRPPGFSEATDEGGTVPIETPTGYVHDRRVVDGARAPAESLSTDGVSCSVCHQISDENLGRRESFVGRFKIDETARPSERRVYGQFATEQGHTTVMKSSSTFRPTTNST